MAVLSERDETNEFNQMTNILNLIRDEKTENNSSHRRHRIPLKTSDVYFPGIVNEMFKWTEKTKVLRSGSIFIHSLTAANSHARYGVFTCLLQFAIRKMNSKKNMTQVALIGLLFLPMLFNSSVKTRHAPPFLPIIVVQRSLCILRPTKEF
jgi:hypothetical protein